MNEFVTVIFNYNNNNDNNKKFFSHAFKLIFLS